MDVLKGGERLIQKNKPIILVETVGSDLDNSANIDKHLFDLGYRGHIRVAEKDTLYFHSDSPACRVEVFNELVNSHRALTKKFHKPKVSFTFNELVADVDRESDRIKSLFGI